MNAEQLTEVVSALHHLSLVQSGQLAAQKTIIDALIAAIGVSLPPIADQLSSHIDGLAPFARSSLEPESISSFESGLAAVRENIRILTGG